MPVKELPVLITPSIASDPNKLAKAVMRNFDHLIGEAGYIIRQVDSGVDTGVMEEIAAAASGSSELLTKLNDAGVGPPDGTAPTIAPATITLTPGINYDIWVLWTTVKNNSPLSFLVERRIGTGGAWTPAGETTVVPGTESDGRWQFHDESLALNTNYYYRVAAKDEDGQGPWSAEAGPVQVNKTVGEQIADATINLATKVSGLLPNANLAQISDPAKLASAVVTAGKLAPGSINASDLIVGNVIVGSHILGGSIVAGHIASNQIVAGHIAAGQVVTGHMAANTINGDRITGGTIHGNKLIAGTVIADEIFAKYLASYTIEGGTITGSTIRTANSGARVELNTGGQSEVLKFYDSSGGYGNIYMNAASMEIWATNPGRVRILNPTFLTPPRWDASLYNTNPGVTAGGAQALPATPVTWIQIHSPGGAVRWIPAWG